MAMQANETSFGAPPQQQQAKDWRKMVTLDPVSHLSFRPVEGDRPQTNLKLINKGSIPIMFKIKTTKPQRYLVRPSQGVVGQNNDVHVQVLFTTSLDGPDEDDAIANDKFLVQLTPAPTGFSMEKLDGRDLMQELIKHWTMIDRKDKYEFRLRVAKRKDAPQAAVNPNAAATPAPSDSQPQSVVRSSMGGNEEQPKQLEKMKQDYQNLQHEKIQLNARLSQLQKLEDSQSFDKNKKSAIVGNTGTATPTSAANSGSQGFQFFHLILIALISLLVGAFISRSVKGESGGDL